MRAAAPASSCFLTILMACGGSPLGQSAPPLKLIQTMPLPAAVKGHFDHFGIDLQGHRLFATPEDYESVLVLDLRTGAVIHKIEGIGRPHAVLYRPDLDRLYVTDGGDGDLKIYDGQSYRLLNSVKLLPDADSIGYDAATKYLYIDNGGGDAGQTYSMLSVVDTTSAKKLADIRIDGDTLEAMALSRSGPEIYVNNRRKNQISVVNRRTRKVLASWPITKCTDNVAMAFDEGNHRLFVGCRSGRIDVLDSGNGKELQSLPISKGVDDLTYDPAAKRLYAACDGSVDIFAEKDPDHYEALGKVSTGPSAKTALLVPQLKRYFVAAPQHGNQHAAVLVYEVH